MFSIIIYLFLTAWREDVSCGNNDLRIAWWNSNSNDPNLESKSASMSKASNCTDTSCYKYKVLDIFFTFHN